MRSKNIVLLHGWGASREKLVPLEKFLQKLNWKVYLPQIRGFNSPPPDEVWGVEDYAHYVYKESKEFFGSSSFFVFGHSFGGRLAIEIGSGKKVAGVILCAAGGLSRPYGLKRALFTTVAKAGKVFLLVPFIADEFRKILYKAAREHDYEKAEGIMKHILRKVVSKDLKPSISQIKVPTLVLWGEKDRMTPMADAYFIKNKLPNSRLVVYKNVGHKLPYEKPKGLAKEIDRWLTTIS